MVARIQCRPAEELLQNEKALNLPRDGDIWQKEMRRRGNFGVARVDFIDSIPQNKLPKTNDNDFRHKCKSCVYTGHVYTQFR